jgi:hypothetical protein
MKFIPLLFFLLVLVTTSNSQNLVPNGDFEEIECLANNINSIDVISTWYACNGADAYWLHENCPLDPDIAESVLFINPNTQPSSGDDYISLEGMMSRNGYFVAERVGVELTDSLKEGVPYYFEMAGLYQRTVDGPNYPGGSCDQLPDRYMEIYLSSEKILVAREENNLGIVKGYSSNANLVLIDSTIHSEGFPIDVWYAFSDCFIAEEGEKHLGIMGSNFKFERQHNCIEEEGFGGLYLFGHSIDAVQLIEMPSEIDTLVDIFENGGWVDLSDYFSPTYLEIGIFIWEDGCTQVRRVIREAATYQAVLETPCFTIPINLDVSFGENCDPVTYSEDFPEKIDLTIVICEEEGAQSINLSEVIPLAMQSEATFLWDDGSEEAQRIFEMAGTSTINVFT